MISHTSGYILQHKKENTPCRLFYNHYTSEDQPIRAAILIVHGMKEHSGRYDIFARFLSEKGFAVLTYDHCGHGHSVNDKTALGYFQKDKPDKKLVQDAELLADKLKALYPDTPRFVLGHSMGSFVTRLLLQHNADKFRGAIFTGTGGKNPTAVFSKPLIGLLNKISPTRRSNFINSTFDKMNNMRFKNEPDATSSSWLSLDKANREAFDNDPLCGFPFTNNGFYTLITINTSATKKDWAKNIPKQFPLLFLSGAADPIGNFGIGIKKIVADLKNKGFEDIEMRLYDRMRHEILNESIKSQVYDDITTWIEKHLE